jgi:hypothetical protein
LLDHGFPHKRGGCVGGNADRVFPIRDITLQYWRADQNTRCRKTSVLE